MKIIRNGSQPSTKEPDEYFTGTVQSNIYFAGTEPAAKEMINVRQPNRCAKGIWRYFSQTRRYQ
jgi:hypothetical protein